MMIGNIIRITAVVGLSAIKLVSIALKVKEAKEQGLIDPIFVNHNNSTPYNNNAVMNNNVACNSPQQIIHVQQPVWSNECSESRRFMNTTPVYQYPVAPAPQIVVTPPQPAYVPPQQNYNNTRYDAQSRRYNNNPPMMMNQYQPPIQQQPMWNNNQMSYQKPLMPNVAQYVPKPQLMTINTVNYDTMWGTYNPRQQMNNNYNRQNWNNNQELKWCDKSYGQMMEERRRMYQPTPPPVYQPRNRQPLFNGLNNYQQPQSNDSGIVPMFYANDGTPLFGPTNLSAV